MEKNKIEILFMQKYLTFKAECIDAKIFDMNEIIKLFEVYIKSLKHWGI